MPALIECVPNFSEGRNPDTIRRITERIETVEGVTLLHTDPGKATNRTVVTFAGEPDAVVEAAFRAIAAAAELIDMRQHHGEHPRMGATDVCPLVPISGISMEETAEHARRLAERVGRELRIPVYLYEAAQQDPARKSLSVIRAGEYEGLAARITQPAWKPDFGPAEFNPRSGATVIGARGFLVAYNVNLNTTSTRRANAVAFDVREAGRPKREGHPLTGRIVTSADGTPVHVPGTLKAVKAIGWFIEEYGIAQVSMNLTDLGITPIHTAFEEVSRSAEARGMRVTGSELVGLVPLQALLDAGRHFLRKQQRSLGVPDAEIIHIAVKSLGLDELGPFKPEERIIEYRLRGMVPGRLAAMTLRQFANATAAETAAPGGGSTAALLGALGAALGAMVANLSAHKRGWDERWEEFSRWAERGQELKEELLHLVDADTAAYEQVMAAIGMPKGTPGEQAERREALERANRGAIEVPWTVMRTAYDVFDLVEAMAEHGNPASASDAGVGALAARAAVRGAWLNVRTNVAGLKDRSAVAGITSEGARLEADAAQREAKILQIVERKFGS
ncbi:MAG TPA: glutamate formimidoyltransferase [Gemmatimonadales bacterium]|nr:glutamate formimidoyltransferase [Gemmatimonadales bacterium]